MTSVGARHPVRIIGVGNLFRGDDAAGLLAARRLKALVGDRADVIEAELAGLDVLDLMAEASAVILIDAARSGQPAGTIHRLNASAGPISADLFPHSTHVLNAVDAIEIGRTLGLLPPRVIVYGVEVGDTTAGNDLSPAVAEVLDQVVERVVHELEGLSCTSGS
ncbi:MAG: hydrogenase maturation protease [Nitrospira sp.]|nr:hydrogenase maturation protease [Nitrospira sp.]